MSKHARSFWEAERLTMERSLEETKASLQAYGSLYTHWAIVQPLLYKKVVHA